MKTNNQFFLGIFVIVCSSLLLITGLSVYLGKPKSLEDGGEARFEKIESFRMFEDQNLYGHIIQDKETKSCYLWANTGRAGKPSIIETECSNLDSSKRDPD